MQDVDSLDAGSVSRNNSNVHRFLIFEFHSSKYLGEGIYSVPPGIADEITFREADGQVIKGNVRSRRIEDWASGYPHQLFITHAIPYTPLVGVEKFKS
jgi:hypothetical protein